MMRPWMQPRPGETDQARHSRLARTCCWCGREDVDFPASDAHETRCRLKIQRGPLPDAPPAKESRP